MGVGGKDRAEPEAEEVAAYVAAMAIELKSLVEPHRMGSLAYLLDLVRMEAEERAGGKSGDCRRTRISGA